MDLQKHIDQVVGLSDGHRTIQSARVLASFTDQGQVMDALCEAAVNATSHRVREALIDALKTNPAGACMRFSDYALWSDNPSHRKWALVNLSLMACREAKNAVISGLSDPDGSVREAAAMSTGLYEDKDVLDALERYFESHRFALTLSFIGKGIAALKARSDRLDEVECSDKAFDALRPNT